MRSLKTTLSLLIISCIIISAFSFISVSANTQSTDTITVLVNGNQLNFDVNPMTESDRTLVPMRAIFEALGATVTWDDTTQTATAKKDDTIITITIDNNILYKNGSAVKLDVPARMVGDRTLVPIRAVSEGLGADVKWDEANLQVIITTGTIVGTPTSSPENIIDVNMPSAIPTVTETPTNSPTTQPTETPVKKNGETLSANFLSEADAKTLYDNRTAVADNFVYKYLPEYINSLGENPIRRNFKVSSYEGMLDFQTEFKNIWRTYVYGYVYDLQINSETTYEFPRKATEKFNENTTKDDKIKVLINNGTYGVIAQTAALEFKDHIQIGDIGYYQSDDKTSYSTLIPYETIQVKNPSIYIILSCNETASGYFIAETNSDYPGKYVVSKYKDKTFKIVGLVNKSDLNKKDLITLAASSVN